jgi:hypothetical protein
MEVGVCWPLAAEVVSWLRGLLETRGFDVTRPITVVEDTDRNGFERSQ